MAQGSPEYAGLGSRGLAVIIDSIIAGIIGAILVGMTIGVGTELTDPGYMGLMGFTLVYFIALEGFMGGQTLGKKLVNIKVVTDDGSDITPVGAVIRNVLRIVDMLPFLYIIGIILVVVSDEQQRLGDMVGSTHVVKA